MGNDKLKKHNLESGYTGLTPEKKKILKEQMESVSDKGNSISEAFERMRNFPEDKKKNPLYLISHKNKKSDLSDALELNVNSPSHLEWWYEDEPEKMKIINRHGFELLLILESENVTLKEAADKLIEWYENQKPIRYSDMSENDRKESMEAMDDSEEHDPRESLKQSLIEVKLIKEGKKKAIPWSEVYNKLKNENGDE